MELWPTGNNTADERPRNSAEDKNPRCKHDYAGALEEINLAAQPLERCLRFIHKNYFQHNQVVIERDEAAEERDRDKPEQSLIIAHTQSDAEQIEFAEEPRQRRQTGQGQHENSHASG